MKKNILLSMMVALLSTTVSAQTVNIHFKNGQKVQFNSSNVDYVDFSEKAPDPTLTPGTVVDLGLSVYWSSCNLGATKPEECGEYYAWGETKPNNRYAKDIYSYYNKDNDTWTDIGSNISGTWYDAAKVNLGSDWRMPTMEEMTELVNQCTWVWAQINSVNGYKVTGPNGNSIFIPASGLYNSTFLLNINEQIGLNLWTGSKKDSDEAYVVGYSSYSQANVVGRTVFYGLCIRPVTTNPNAEVIDHTNDHLVTDLISASFTGGAYSSYNGKISSGSQLNWRFTNGSTESVTLTGIHLIDGSTNAEGNNLLTEEVEVAAGETKSYTVTVGAAGISQPKIRFTYRYNRTQYSVEASM